MYQAKIAGKNAFELFLPAMNASVKKRVSMETCLRGALQNGELSLHYQPKIDLMSGALLGLKPCCAGRTSRWAAWCRRQTSSRWRKTAD